MTTPSPDRNRPPASELSSPEAAADETITQQADETPRFSGKPEVAELPDSLTPEERIEATAALGFLDEVRAASQESTELPKSIGRYSILRSLGRGGFAEVFLAEDSELNRRVALKVPLFSTAANDEFRQRFEREARLAATLGHPQIVPVFEYGQVGPLRFIAFEWCDGPPLSNWMDQHSPIDHRDCAKIICHLADAVQHAHQRGIVHRDLKPANVLVDASGDSSLPICKRVRITDFGLARSSDADASLLTVDGGIVGTPAYMSPEQAAGRAEVGPAADVWALGMMLFEMLTGQLPFRRDDMLATARAITDEPVPRVRSVRRDVPAGLDAIVDLCLRKSPEDRYVSAHALAEDLRRWLNGEPVTARPLSALTKAGMWVRRNPIPAVSIASTIAALAVGLGVALWQRNEAVANLREAQTQTERADGNLQTAQALIRDIVALEKRMQSVGQLTEERSNLIRRAAELQRELIEDEVQTPRVRYDTARALQELSTLLGELQQFEESVEVASEALGLIDGLEDDLPEGVTPSEMYELRIQQWIKTASSLNAIDRVEEANNVLALAEAEPLASGVHALQRATWLSEVRRMRSVMLGMQGQRLQSSQELEKGLSYFDGIPAPADQKQRWNFYLCQTRLRTGLGFDLVALQKFDAARENFEWAAEGLDELSGLSPEHPVLQDQRMQLSYHRGALAEQQSEWDEAIDHYRDSRAAALKFFSLNRENLNPANVYVMTGVSLSRVCEQNDEPELALSAARETIEKALGFPKPLLDNEAFQDNLQILKARVAEQDE